MYMYIVYVYVSAYACIHTYVVNDTYTGTSSIGLGLGYLEPRRLGFTDCSRSGAGLWALDGLVSEARGDATEPLREQLSPRYCMRAADAAAYTGGIPEESVVAVMPFWSNPCGAGGRSFLELEAAGLMPICPMKCRARHKQRAGSAENVRLLCRWQP